MDYEEYYEIYETNETSTDFFNEKDGQMCNLKGNHKELMTIQTCLYSIICALGLLGNILVLVTYAFYRKTKNMTDIFLVNVALADLLFVLALPLIIYNENYSWSMGTWACKLLTGTYSINLYSSMLLLACMSGDRYVSIVKARHSFGICTKAQMYSHVICSVIWLLAIALSIPTFMYYRWDKVGFDGVEAECFYSFPSSDTAQLMKILVPSTQVIVGFFVPLLVMGFCYFRVILTLLRAQNYQRHKAVWVVLAVVIVFILCHLPYNVLTLVHTGNLFKVRTCEEEQNVLLALTITKIVAYLDCCLNPILYAFIDETFRSNFYKIIKNLCCLRKRGFSSCPEPNLNNSF